MKKNITLLVMLIACSLAFSQSNSQNTKAALPEIDRLAQKYKDLTTVVIYSVGSEFNCDVKVLYNIDNRPEAIEISGASRDKDEIGLFLSELIKQKQKFGYKLLGNWLPEKETVRNVIFGYENEAFVLEKGNLVFKVSGGSELVEIPDMTTYNPLFPNRQLEPVVSYTSYWFKIETIDTSRKGGSRATKFDF